MYSPICPLTHPTTPHRIEKSCFKGYTHGCSFPSSIVSQQGSDIPFIEVEAEVVHCSFGSINLCYAMEGDSQGEVSGLRFHMRVRGTFDTKEKGQAHLLQCSRCCATSLISEKTKIQQRPVPFSQEYWEHVTISVSFWAFWDFFPFYFWSF